MEMFFKSSVCVAMIVNQSEPHNYLKKKEQKVAIVTLVVITIVTQKIVMKL